MVVYDPDRRYQAICASLEDERVRELVINEGEAATVRMIFERFVRLRGCLRVRKRPTYRRRHRRRSTRSAKCAP